MTVENEGASMIQFRSCACGTDSKKACSECGGLRLVPIPERFQPDYVSGSAFDPDTLRLAAQTHADHHAISGSFTLKPWVVLYLLAVWEAAVEAANYQMFTASGHPKSHHIVDRNLWEAIYGSDWCDEDHAKEGSVVDI